MTDASAQRVLDRFVEADALLREAQEQLVGLTVARTSAEASAVSLATAAAAISAYAESARTATEVTVQVQEQAARALLEAETLSRSFDTAQLMAAVSGLESQIAEMHARTDAVAQGLDDRLLALELTVGSLPSSVEAMGRRVTKHVSTHVLGLRAEVEAVRHDLHAGHNDAVEQRNSVEVEVQVLADRLEAGFRGLQTREAEEAQMISGIVDVLPRRSRRRLGR